MNAPIIGILAGMGPHSTAPFIDMLVRECQRQYGARNDIDFPPMMVYSLPTPFYPDRPIDHVAMEQALNAGLAVLERAGVAFLAIACNTAHIYHGALVRRVNLPLLNMVGLAVAELPAVARKVALIAARPTVESGIYQEAIRSRGCDCVELEWQSTVDAMLESMRETMDSVALSASWSALEASAREAGVDAIVLACADLSAVSVPIGRVVVDATRVLAREIISRWLQEKGR